MRTARLATLISATLFVLLPTAGLGAAHGRWRAGTWDSTIYNLVEHPRTIAIRLEVVDSETQMPVEGAQVALRGTYVEKWVGRSGDQVGMPLEPQERQFKMTAMSDEEGLVVFALGWQKEYPWRNYFGEHPPRDYRSDGGGWSVKTNWISAVDDIEKIQRIEIRHPQYAFNGIAFDFKQLIEFGQDKKSQMQHPDLFDRFDQAWHNEIRNTSVKFFVLDLETGFPDFNNVKAKGPEFFQRVHDEAWGTTYQKAYNYFSKGEHPQSLCGPYFVYLLREIPLVRRTQQIEISSGVEMPTPSASGQVSHKSSVRSERQWRCPSCGKSYAGQAAPNFCPRCGKAWGPGAEIQPPTSELLDQEKRLLKAQLAKVSELSLPSLEEIRNDPAKLAELVQKTGTLKNQLAIGGLRALPMVDPDTGQMTTLDAYARQMAEDEQLGGSLGEDPVATAYMMLIDSNFLVDEARIVRLKDGQYVSLTEALGVAAAESDSGLDPEVLQRAVRTAATVHQASRLSEGQLLTKALTSLPFAVSELNAFGAGPKSPGGPSVSDDEALYCPELSMHLKTLTPELRMEFGLYAGVEGVVIASIDADAPPGHEDLKPGMVIYSWGHRGGITDADALAQKARGLVSNPATVRGSGRDQVLLGIWKWNGASWESGYENIWVIRKGGTNGATAKSKSIDLGMGLSMEFVRMEPGYFYMGSETSESGRDSDEGPVRRVQISRSFYLAKYEVTQDQYMAIMGKNPSHFSGINFPVESVSWNDAVDFCKRLSQRAGATCRLPTEAEWEYACRAGANSRFYFGNSDSALKDYAWYEGNSGRTTHAVGQKKPNAWGLYDMSGNVYEWCQDWYKYNGYRNASIVDPEGPSSGSGRVCRGGSWASMQGTAAPPIATTTRRATGSSTSDFVLPWI